jgi:hypothetical protein
MHTLRLLKSYRGYKAGEVIKATPNLAETLQASGVAVIDPQASFLEPAKAERAVGVKVQARQAIETR